MSAVCHPRVMVSLCCPNKGEIWSQSTLSFMALKNVERYDADLGPFEYKMLSFQQLEICVKY